MSPRPVPTSDCRPLTAYRPQRKHSHVANIKSQLKRIKTNRLATERNKAIKSELKTAIRKFREAADAGNADEAKAALAGRLDQARQGREQGRHPQEPGREQEVLDGQARPPVSDRRATPRRGRHRSGDGPRRTSGAEWPAAASAVQVGHRARDGVERCRGQHRALAAHRPWGRPARRGRPAPRSAGAGGPRRPAPMSTQRRRPPGARVAVVVLAGELQAEQPRGRRVRRAAPGGPCPGRGPPRTEPRSRRSRRGPAVRRPVGRTAAPAARCSHRGMPALVAVAG